MRSTSRQDEMRGSWVGSTARVSDANKIPSGRDEAVCWAPENNEVGRGDLEVGAQVHEGKQTTECSRQDRRRGYVCEYVARE